MKIMTRYIGSIYGVLAASAFVLASCAPGGSQPEVVRQADYFKPAAARPSAAVLPSPSGPSSRARESSKGVDRALFVSVTGSDANNGTSAQTALASIQTAVDRARAGYVIHLAPGTYLQDVHSVADGTAEAPITITGPAEAVVNGAGKINIVKIEHDHMVLDGFTIDGQWGSKDTAAGFRRKLIYAQSMSGLRVLRMTLRNAGSACLRLQEDITAAEIAFNTIVNCGWIDFKFNGGGVNGEGVYIGTALNHSGGIASDTSRQNWIHHNAIDTRGSECIDIKPGSSRNLIEHNICSGSQKAGITLAGDHNVVRENEISGVRDAAIILRGVNNEVYDNHIHDNGDGIHFYASRQGKICCNVMRNTGRVAIGTAKYDPTAPSN